MTADAAGEEKKEAHREKYYPKSAVNIEAFITEGPFTNNLKKTSSPIIIIKEKKNRSRLHFTKSYQIISLMMKI